MKRTRGWVIRYKQPNGEDCLCPLVTWGAGTQGALWSAWRCAVPSDSASRLVPPLLSRTACIGPCI